MEGDIEDTQSSSVSGTCWFENNNSGILEMAHLRKTFMVNGYPSSLILRRLHRQNHPPPPQEDTTPQGILKLLYLPYVELLSEHLQRVCRQIDVQTVFRSSGTLRSSLIKVKCRRPPLMKKGVLYKVSSLDCNMSYIGSEQKMTVDSERQQWTSDRERQWWAYDSSRIGTENNVGGFRSITKVVGDSDGLQTENDSGGHQMENDRWAPLLPLSHQFQFHLSSLS